MRTRTSSIGVYGITLACVLVLGACAGAGGNSGGGSQGQTPSGTLSVSLVVSSPEIESGATATLSAQVEGTSNPAVTWSVNDVPNGNDTVGTITGAGDTVTYTAPATEGTYTLSATSVADATKSGSATIAVRKVARVSSVAVSPASFSLNTGAQKQLAATVTGTGSYSSAVTWKAQRGSVTSAGLYTAPSTGGSDVVTATSTQNTSKLATSSVTVTVASAVTSVAVSPSTSSLNTGSQQQFAATVAGSGSYSTAVTWSAQRGTITSAGLYTAPSTSGSDVVTATSAQDTTKKATASITVSAVPATITSVTVSPTSFSLNTGAQKQFAATVAGSGSYSAAVTWSAQRGSITSAGLYTAPATSGSDVVTVTSVQDTSKLASSSVTVTVAPATITSVAVSPTTSTLGTGAQKQFAAAVSGTGSYSSAVTWSAQRGSITSAGLYTAPATGGSDVVTAKSTQDATKLASASVTVSSGSSVALGPLAAFPGAEGFGAGATGGRGGVVYTVNSLDDVYSEGTKYPTANNGPNGPKCTLRDALQASGTRTVVFSVSGTITLHGPIYPVPGNLTIAGQTSPGGIQIQGDGTFGTGGAMIHITGNNVIIRYLRIRPGLAPLNSSNQGLAGIVQDKSLLEDQILDHCSFEWDGAKPWAYGLSKRVTLSWNLMAESMIPHSTGPLINAGTSDQTNLDLSSFDGHHNVMASIDHRLPYSNTKYFRWVNNLVFGYNYAGLVRGNVHADIIGNVFDGLSARIPDDSSRQEWRWADTVAHNENQTVPGGDPASLYMSNNFGPHNTDGTADNFLTMLRIASNENGQLNNLPVDTQYRSTVPATMLSSLNDHPITVTHLNAYTDLRNLLTATAGAYQRLAADGSWVANRDSVDSRVVSYILNPSTSPSSYISSPGALPVLSGTAALDSDGDGMPDVWEDAHGLDKQDASDGKTIRSGASGYTNLELYLSGLYPNGTPLP